MTVGEVIESLNDLPKDMEVMVWDADNCYHKDSQIISIDYDSNECYIDY